METEAGLIAILGHETARWGRFWDCALSLDRPPGTSIAKAYGIDVPHARNLMFEKAEAEGADWVWFIDDDHSFPPEFLHNLLAARTPDGETPDIVQPLVLRRYAPFLPVVQRVATVAGYPTQLVGQTLEELGPPGGARLAEVDTLGMGGTLVRRRVWTRVERPWFRYAEVKPDRVAEDIGFCVRAREAGFRCWVDLEHPIGHLVVAEVWPQWDDERGHWTTSLRIDDLDIRAPATRKKHQAAGLKRAEQFGLTKVTPLCDGERDHAAESGHGAASDVPPWGGVDDAWVD